MKTRVSVNHAKILLFLAAGLFCQSFSSNAQPAARDILGEWMNDIGDRKIEFVRGANSTYAARVTWLRVPNEKVRKGDVIIRDLRFEQGRFVDGKVFAPRNGGWIDCSVTYTNSREINITGSKGLLQRTTTWKR